MDILDISICILITIAVLAVGKLFLFKKNVDIELLEKISQMPKENWAVSSKILGEDFSQYYSREELERHKQLKPLFELKLIKFINIKGKRKRIFKSRTMKLTILGRLYLFLSQKAKNQQTT